MESEVNRPSPDSVELALSQVGDRWSFLILREVFFGVRRFEQIRANTGASPAVAAERLKTLVANDILTKSLYSNHKSRFEYRLSPKGLDVYPIILLIMRWGDRWLNADNPPLSLKHSCGAVDSYALRCDGCGETVEAHSMAWSLN